MSLNPKVMKKRPKKTRNSLMTKIPRQVKKKDRKTRRKRDRAQAKVRTRTTTLNLRKRRKKKATTNVGKSTRGTRTSGQPTKRKVKEESDQKKKRAKKEMSSGKPQPPQDDDDAKKKKKRNVSFLKKIVKYENFLILFRDYRFSFCLKT